MTAVLQLLHGRAAELVAVVGRTWHTEVRLTVELIEAALPVDLAQVVAGAGVGVAWMDDLLDVA